MPNHRAVHGRQMPWLTLGAPGRMTCLHHAHTRVGKRRAAWMALFMVANLDSVEATMFTVFSGEEVGDDTRDYELKLSEVGKPCQSR